MTPGGLLQRNDRIVHSATDTHFEVVKREGNDRSYAVILRPVGPLPIGTPEAYGYPGCFRLLNADFWLSRGVYKVMEGEES